MVKGVWFRIIKNRILKVILYIKKKLFSEKLANVEKKNSLLTENLDLDYLETIYRKKFMIGKSNEKVYTNY